MKKKLMFFAVLYLIVAVCSAWAAGQKEEAATKAKEPVTITFWFPSANPTNDTYFSSLGPEFSVKNPQIKVETIVVSSSDAEINQKLNTAVLSKTYPDVFSAFLVFIGTRGAKGEFLDLKDSYNAWEDKNDIFESTIEMGQYKGTLIGIGFFPAPVLRVYRRDYFAEAGLDPSKGPSTWEELMEISKKATVRDAKGNVVRAGYDVPSSDQALVFTEPFLRQNGSKVVDEVNQKPSFTDPGAIEALQFIGKLYNENVSLPHEWSSFDMHPFMNNRSAMGNIMTSHIMNLIKNDASLKDKFGYAPVMKRKEQWAFCGYRFFIIGAESKYKKESWEFMKFMLSADQFWKRHELLAIPPVRKSLMERFIAADPERNTRIAEHVQYGKGKPVTPWTNIYNKYVRVAYQEVLNKVKTAEQALKDAEAGLLEELKVFKP